MKSSPVLFFAMNSHEENKMSLCERNGTTETAYQSVIKHLNEFETDTEVPVNVNK